MTVPSVPPRTEPCQHILVIGYGNELCGDDAVGPYIAKIVSSWDAANVVTLAVSQLTPELAATLKDTSCVIFIDAAHEALDEIRIKPVPSPTPPEGQEADATTLSHAMTPAHLLNLSQLLYGNHPRAWIMEIPATNFQLGQEFSPQTEAGIRAALVEMEHILRQGDLCQMRPVIELA